MSTLVRIDGLTVRYRGAAQPALREVTLEIARNERLALIGESGSGKSTLARALAGLLPEGTAQQGTGQRGTGQQGTGQPGAIRWPGGPLRPGRGIGYVFQDPGGSLDPLVSIGGHLREVLHRHFRLSGAAARARALALLARVQIPAPQAALAAYPHQFSGGQRQRIAIALAIAGQPALLIADEATSALDVIVQAEIVALLRDLCTAEAMTLVFITHDLALAAGLAQRIAVLRDGRLVETGPAAQVLGAPREAYTRQLLAAHLDLASPRLVGNGAEA